LINDFSYLLLREVTVGRPRQKSKSRYSVRQVANLIWPDSRCLLQLANPEHLNPSSEGHQAPPTWDDHCWGRDALL